METSKNDEQRQGDHTQAKKPFPATTLKEVAGILHGQATPKSDEEIEQAMEKECMRLRKEADRE